MIVERHLALSSSHPMIPQQQLHFLHDSMWSLLEPHTLLSFPWAHHYFCFALFHQAIAKEQLEPKTHTPKISMQCTPTFKWKNNICTAFSFCSSVCNVPPNFTLKMMLSYIKNVHFSFFFLNSWQPFIGFDMMVPYHYVKNVQTIFFCPLKAPNTPYINPTPRKR